jgi:hypothetical protein
MKIELFGDIYKDVAREALEIVERVGIHAGEFSYMSQIYVGKDNAFTLEIFPFTGEICYGQPQTHPYINLYMVRTVDGDLDKRLIARFHKA